MRRKYKYSLETKQHDTDFQPQTAESVVNTDFNENTKTPKEINTTPIKSNAVCVFCGNPINKNLPHCKYCGTETYKSMKTYNNYKNIKINTEKELDSFRIKITPNFIIDNCA